MAESVSAKQLKGLIERNIHFSKGDAGRLLIIAGEYPGSAGLAALAALRAGVDSVRVIAPASVARTIAAYSPDIVTVPLDGEHLVQKHVQPILAQAKTASVILVGPGFGVGDVQRAILTKLTPFRLVLDADATKQADLAAIQEALILANEHEYEPHKESVPAKLGTNVFLVKGFSDLILTSEEQYEVTGGHPRAAVSGTGDVLAGAAAALLAQSGKALVAAQAASFILKRAAEQAASTRYFGFLASDLVECIPRVINETRLFRVTRHQPTELKRALKQGGSLWSWRSRK